MNAQPDRAGLRLGRRTLAELLGTGLLVTVVVGSGIAAQRLSSDAGLQLLENSIATALGLGVLILLFGPVSGAHFNPAVSLADAILGRRSDSCSRRGHSTSCPLSPSPRRTCWDWACGSHARRSH